MKKYIFNKFSHSIVFFCLQQMETFDVDRKLIAKLIGRISSEISEKQQHLQQEHASGGTETSSSNFRFRTRNRKVKQLPSNNAISLHPINGSENFTPLEKHLLTGNSANDSSFHVTSASSTAQVSGVADTVDVPESSGNVHYQRNASKRRNTSMGGKAVKITKQYISSLTKEERRLLYIAYYLDFEIFEYTFSEIV